MKIKKFTAAAIALTCVSSMISSFAISANAFTNYDSSLLIPIDYSEYGLGCNIDSTVDVADAQQADVIDPDYQEEYTFVNGEERVTVDRYEATQRSLYVINTYGDKDYFGIAFEELTSKSITQPMDTAAENVAHFFELPLSEIESKLDVSRSESNTSQIVVSFSNDQLRKLVSELEPQKEEIGNDSELFRKAFFDLLLDKLHLTGIYDVADPEYLYTVTEIFIVEPSEVWVLDDFGDDRITIITCTDDGTQRQVVVGKLK